MEEEGSNKIAHLQHRGPAEIVSVALEAILASVPYCGALGVVVRELLPSRQKRLESAYRNYVAPMLQKHEELFRDAQQKYEDYVRRDEFQDLWNEINDKMQKEGRKEKLKAYASFFAHALLETNDDFDELREFLRMIDWFTVRQLVILGIWWRICHDAEFKLQLVETNQRPITLAYAMARYTDARKLSQPQVHFADKSVFEFFGILVKTKDHVNWLDTIELVTGFGSKFDFRELTPKGMKFLSYSESQPTE